MSKLITINETIKYLQESYGISLSKSTIYKYTSSGKFVSYKLGRAVLLDIDQIVEMICTPRKRVDTQTKHSIGSVDKYNKEKASKPVVITFDSNEEECSEAYISYLLAEGYKKKLKEHMSTVKLRDEEIGKMEEKGIEDPDKYIFTVDEYKELLQDAADCVKEVKQ